MAVDLDGIIKQLYAHQGDLLSLLRDMAPDDEPQRQQILFDIMYELKGDEKAEQDWNLLIELHNKRNVLMAEANLYNVIARPMTAEAKPEKILAVLERVLPERWARRQHTSTKTVKNPYAKIMGEPEDGT